MLFINKTFIIYKKKKISKKNKKIKIPLLTYYLKSLKN